MSAFVCPVVKTDTVMNLLNVFAMKDGKDYVAINVSSYISFVQSKYFHCVNSAQCGECEHGFCSAPGVCTCHPGYIGDKCQFCQASPDCKNGYCHETAFQCKCYPGWTGYYCDQPICHEGCHPDRVSTFK